MGMQEELTRAHRLANENAFSESDIHPTAHELWAGPGKHEIDRRMRHNKELISRVLGDNLSSPRADVLWGSDNSEVAGNKGIKKLSRYDKEYYRKAGLLGDAYHNAMFGSGPRPPHRLLGIANDIEAFVVDVEQLLDRLDLTGKSIVPGYLPGALVEPAMLLTQYAQAILKVDPDESHEASKRCIEVSTFALQLVEFQNLPDGENLKTLQRVLMLLTRGRCKKRLGEYRGALADFRATRALIALAGQEWKRNPTLEEVTTEILAVLALMKSGTSRPHFSEEKTEKWQKELGLSVFSHDKYQCSYCGVEKSDGQNLMQCSRCRYRWYCGAECQRAAWTETHKGECKQLRRLMESNGCFEHYDEIMAVIDNGGTDNTCDEAFVLVGGEHFGQIFMKDPDTGELFDSLTNKTFTRLSS